PPRPGTARQHDRLTGNAALFGNDAGDPPGRRLDATDRAARQDRRAAPPRAFGDRGRCHLRLGLAVARGVERPGPAFRRSGQQLADFGAVDQPRVELIFTGVLEPRLHVAERLGALAEIHDAAGAIAGLRLDGPVHA